MINVQVAGRKGLEKKQYVNNLAVGLGREMKAYEFQNGEQVI